MDDPLTIGLTSLSAATVTAEFINGTFIGSFTDTQGSTHSFETVEASADVGIFVVVGEDAVEAGVSAGWIVDNDGNERGALFGRSRFETAPRFQRTGMKLENTGFTVARISMRNNVIAPSNIISPDNILKTPTPAGPIPIPFPNSSVVTVSK